MQAEANRQSDILWRLAPWLTLAAMTMTVLSYAPAEPAVRRHAAGAAGPGCDGQGQGQSSPAGTALNNQAEPSRVAQSN